MATATLVTTWTTALRTVATAAVTATLATDATRRTPTMPVMAAALAEAAPPSIAAPVPADVLDVTRRSGVVQPVEQRRGLRAIDVEGPSRSQPSPHSELIERDSEVLHAAFCGLLSVRVMDCLPRGDKSGVSAHAI